MDRYFAQSTDERITCVSSSQNRVKTFDVLAIIHRCEPKTQVQAMA